ncbi:MAG: MBL fold metallo-hydrolase [Bacteroidota bacterium]|nr:MBL fold metallo-hydrolase [Bacteroidota bacterium]
MDAGPDFRMQMLAHDIGHLDAILLTHNHKDHTSGLDDVRALNYIDRKAMEIFCEQRVLQSLRNDYSYAFAEHKYPGSPEWNIHVIDEKPFRVYDRRNAPGLEWVHDVGYRYVPVEGVQEEPESVEVIPIRGYHDQLPVLGFRFGDIAYITDMSRLPDEELSKLQGLRHLTLNTVSYKPHHSHFSLDEAIALSERIGAEHTWLTHLSHTFPRHELFAKNLATRTGGKVLPAFDGLTIE